MTKQGEFNFSLNWETSKTHCQIISAYETYLGENYEFETKNIKAAAVRARKALGQLAELIKTRRGEIQERKTLLKQLSTLGISIGSNSSKEQIKKQFRTEFAKWNNRINTLDEGPERENAQHMLNLIAEARQKYV